MSDFVLVHGAWHGGWCWTRVLDRLRARGHRAFAPTLTGVGERAHLLWPGITLETHIADVRGLIEAEELERPVLVVHSYAGMIGTALADRMGERWAHLTYVDAVVPKPGESWSGTHASATRNARLADAAADPQGSFAPPDPAVFGLAAADYEWVKRRQTRHPGKPYTDALDFDPWRVAEVPRSFIDCNAPALGTITVIRQRVRDPRFWDGAWVGGAGARLMELATGHDPMISAPEALTDQLCEAAGAAATS